jgi:hypothetical protein
MRRWQFSVNNENDMACLIYPFGCLEEAAGSTPICASRNMPVLRFGFGKAKFESTLFILNL